MRFTLAAVFAGACLLCMSAALHFLWMGFQDRNRAAVMADKLPAGEVPISMSVPKTSEALPKVSEERMLEASPYLRSIPEESASESRSPLVAKLPSDLSEARREFAQRISNRFPVGSPETDLIAALSAEGFVAPEPSRLPGGGALVNEKGSVFRQRRKGRCISMLGVGWSADEKQNISTTKAVYHLWCW
jgi:hypothetical protein